MGGGGECGGGGWDGGVEGGGEFDACALLKTMPHQE